MKGRRSAAACLTLLLALTGSALGQDREQAEDPREIGLVERAGSRLAQLDVTAIGPSELVGTLRAEDFQVRINLRRLTEFQLDRLCPAEPPAAREATPSPAATEPPADYAATSSAATYLFYFDQPHLTLAGRQRALDVARELIPQLVTPGVRAQIVSNAARLAVIEPFTESPQALLAALDRLERDRTQWDPYSEQERGRIEEVARVLNDAEDVQRAISIARIHQKEERWRTDQSLRRLELTLGRLADLDPPKVLVYFADTLRENPGEHYMSFFGYLLRQQKATLGAMSADSISGALAFDRVVNEASASGIRLYTVQAEGLVHRFDPAVLNPKAMDATKNVPHPSRVRVADTQRTLTNMAAETGGHAFLNGVRPPKIVERLRSDASCFYLVSFDPVGFPQDSPLRVSVQVERPGVQLRVRGRIVLQSDATRLTSRLLRAFGSPDSLEDPFKVNTGIVPTGFEDGAYRALLQVHVPGTPLQGATWDLGASIVSRRKVREKTSGRIRVSGPGVPVVLEQEIRLKPGAHEVVTVAHEAKTGWIASDELNVDWPAPSAARATVPPIALLQPTPGAFLRAGESRKQGSLARSPSDPVYTDRPTAMIALVCRARSQSGELRVERELTGRSTRSFEPLVLDLEEDRCAQLRDVLPAGSLGRGFHRYEVRVVEEDRLLVSASREFFAVEAESP